MYLFSCKNHVDPPMLSSWCDGLRYNLAFYQRHRGKNILTIDNDKIYIALTQELSVLALVIGIDITVDEVQAVELRPTCEMTSKVPL